MSDISLLPDQFRNQESEIRKETVREQPTGVLSMHIPKSENEEIEVIEVEEGEVDQLLVGEPFYSRLYYRLSLWVEEAKEKLFHAREVEPPPKLPPQFFKPPAAKQAQPAAVLPTGQKEPEKTGPVALAQTAEKPLPPIAGTAGEKPKARIIPSAPGKGKRVRIIKRTHRPVQVSLLDERFVSAMQVDVGKRKFTLAFLMVLFAAVFAGSYFLLDRMQTAAAQEQADVTKNFNQLKTQITDAQGKWKAYQDLEPRLVALNDLLDKHVALSKVFGLLERNTLADVSYANLTLDQAGRASMAVTAASYPVAARQLAVYKETPEIVSAEANAFSGDADKGVSFQLSLQIKPGALLYAYKSTNATTSQNGL